MTKVFQSLKLILSLVLVFLSACSQNQFSLAPSTTILDYVPYFNSKVDILFVIDDSSSMTIHQEYLAETAPLLLHKLQDQGFDFHIAATTTDLSQDGERGRLVGNPKFITKATSTASTDLKSKIIQGTDGSTVEKGLGAIRLSLSEPLVLDENKGFLRPDSFLLLVILSNENDYSEGSTQEYIQFLDELKPALGTRERNWMMHFIGVTGAEGENCRTFGDYKDVGQRYIDIANLSGGFVSTICTANLKTVLNNVEKALLTLLTEINLDRVPKVETIKVVFNGVPVPNDSMNGWTYHEENNSVLFHGGYIPKVQTKIEINFDPVEPK